MVYCVYVRVEWYSLDNSFIMLKSIEILGLRFFYFDESVCSKKKSIGAGVQWWMWCVCLHKLVPSRDPSSCLCGSDQGQTSLCLIQSYLIDCTQESWFRVSFNLMRVIKSEIRYQWIFGWTGMISWCFLCVIKCQVVRWTRAVSLGIVLGAFFCWWDIWPDEGQVQRSQVQVLL